MRKTKVEIDRESAPSGCRSGRWSHLGWPAGGSGRGQLNASIDECESPGLLMCGACRHGLRASTCPDRRDRSKIDPRPSVCSHHPRAGGVVTRDHLGRRDALGRAVSRPEDPSDRSRPRAILLTIDRRFVTGVTGHTATLHATWEAERQRSATLDPQREVWRSSSCRLLPRVGARVRWRSVLLWGETERSDRRHRSGTSQGKRLVYVQLRGR